MDFKLIMENWRKFSSVISEQNNNVASLQKWFWDRGFAHNPKNKTEEEWVDGKVGPEYRQTVRNFQTKAKELKIYSRSVDAKVGSGTLAAIKDYDSAVAGGQQKPATKKPATAPEAGAIKDQANIQNAKQADSEIGEAIQKLSAKDLRTSTLFYDGAFLYWMVGGSPIRKWAASSGKYDILIDNPWKAKLVSNMFMKLEHYKGPVWVDMDPSNSDKERIAKGGPRQGYWEDINGEQHGEDPKKPDLSNWKKPEDFEIARSLRYLVEFAPSIRAGESQDTVIIPFRTAERLLDVMKSGKRKEVMSMLEFLFDRYNIDEFMPASEKRKASAQKNIGPIPEGQYSIIHKLQELPQNRKTAPSLYDTLFLSMASFVETTDSAVLPYERITNAEFEKSIGSKISATTDASVWAKVKDAVDWGNFRVRITKMNQKAARLRKARGAGYNKRDGFMIHGGSIRGSSGCIDLGEEMDSFAKFWVVAGVGKAVFGGGRPGSLQRSRLKIPLVVRYSDEAKEQLISKNNVAKRYQKAIFSQT